jgi:hypothetical protein
MTETTLTPAAEIAASIDRAWRHDLEARRHVPTKHDYVYASSFRECTRRMVYEMTVPDQQPALDAHVLAKFRRGDDRERDLLADLTTIGRNADPPFRIIGQQERFALRDRKSRTVVVGKVDARLEINGARAPIEVKSWSPFLVDRLDRFDDVFANRWTQSGGYQLLSYLFGAGEPFGFLLLDQSGVPKLLPVELDRHLDRVEVFLTRAELALDHVVAGTLPDFLEGEPDECTTRCPFYGATCNPPLSAPGGLTVLDDPELEAALERREAIKKIGKEFNDLDDELKKRLRGVTRGVVGKFEVRGYWGKQPRLELPADVKAKYTTVDPRGRFTLQITRHE